MRISIKSSVATKSLVVFLATVVPFLSHAGTSSSTAPATPSGGGGLSFKLQNPIAFDSIEKFLVAILNIIIVIATPIVVIFIILAGFKYVTAHGNPAKITEATQALTYAIIGGVLIIGAVAIARIIANLVGAFG